MRKITIGMKVTLRPLAECWSSEGIMVVPAMHKLWDNSVHVIRSKSARGELLWTLEGCQNSRENYWVFSEDWFVPRPILKLKHIK